MGERTPGVVDYGQRSLTVWSAAKGGLWVETGTFHVPVVTARSSPKDGVLEAGRRNPVGGPSELALALGLGGRVRSICWTSAQALGAAAVGISTVTSGKVVIVVVIVVVVVVTTHRKPLVVPEQVPVRCAPAGQSALVHAAHTRLLVAVAALAM